MRRTYLPTQQMARWVALVVAGKAKRNARDMQRSKLYRAERLTGFWPKGSSQQQAANGWSLDECRTYCEVVTEDAWFRRTFGHHVLMLKDGRGTSHAWGSTTGTINLPRWARHEGVILHEIAHVVTIVRPAHGWAFAHNFLLLVKHFMGDDEWRKLRAAFKEKRVRFNAPSLNRKGNPAALAKHRRAATRRDNA